VNSGLAKTLPQADRSLAVAPAKVRIKDGYEVGQHHRSDLFLCGPRPTFLINDSCRGRFTDQSGLGEVALAKNTL